MKRVMIVSLLLFISVCGSVEMPPKRVMIDAYHSAEGAKPEVNMVAITKIMAESFSFDVKRQPLTRSLLKEYDVVILCQPYNILEDTEIEAVVNYVRDGGGLIICGDQDVGWNDSSRSTYNKLGATFSIIFTANAIDDPTDKMGCYCTPIIHNLTVHPLTEGVSQIVLYRPCALRISGDAVAIARGDNDTHTVGADKIDGENIIVVAVSEYERGRVVVLGSHTVFDDSFINQPNNKEFSFNVLTWVSEQSARQNKSWYALAGVIAVMGILILLIALKKRL